jgi:hypothetical protein
LRKRQLSFCSFPRPRSSREAAVDVAQPLARLFVEEVEELVEVDGRVVLTAGSSAVRERRALAVGAPPGGGSRLM